jgi:hypothetical protein
LALHDARLSTPTPVRTFHTIPVLASQLEVFIPLKRRSAAPQRY